MCLAFTLVELWEVPLCHWVITEADEEAREYWKG